MNAKNVLGFLLCSSAFTKRNITSLGLVGFFFFVYVLAGGKIDTAIPSPSKLGTFGSGEADPIFNMGQDQNKSTEVLGITANQERLEREKAQQLRGRIFNQDERKALESEEIDRSGLIEGSKESNLTERERRAIERSQKREVDPLLAIEERLNKIRK